MVQESFPHWFFAKKKERGNKTRYNIHYSSMCMCVWGCMLPSASLKQMNFCYKLQWCSARSLRFFFFHSLSPKVCSPSGTFLHNEPGRSGKRWPLYHFPISFPGAYGGGVLPLLNLPACPKHRRERLLPSLFNPTAQPPEQLTNQPNPTYRWCGAA